MNILAVGSVAYDSVHTPFGSSERTLGGSAVYFALAASFFARVRLVGIVGDDFRNKDRRLLEQRNIDLSGLEQKSGQTFHWEGQYGYDLGEPDTLTTDLNVFEHFNPQLPSPYPKTEVVFLGNIAPQLQQQVLHQVEDPEHIACDTMNFWIQNESEALEAVLAAADTVLINSAEARQLAEDSNVVRACRNILARGPKTVIVKRGEFGAIMFSQDACFVTPAYPLEDVKDPTGAGDTFAGGLLGYLTGNLNFGIAAVRQGIVIGCVLASFCVEAFGVKRLCNIDYEDIRRRYRTFRQLTHFDEIEANLTGGGARAGKS